jgi:AraC-like DNA-binding protein
VLSLSFPISDYRERHFSVAEIASHWGLSEDTVRRLFQYEDGVMVISHHRRGTRMYKSIRIPESVVARVYAKLTKGNGNGTK